VAVVANHVVRVWFAFVYWLSHAGPWTGDGVGSGESHAKPLTSP
jgi:hypothetical protein